MKPCEVFGSQAATLQDLFGFLPSSVEGRDAFLAALIAHLKTTPGKFAEKTLREAVSLSGGVDGLAKLARTEGKRYPKAYLEWFAALAHSGEHQQILLEAERALSIVERGNKTRAGIADALARAAQTLGEGETFRRARWEAFSDDPSLDRLLDLRDGVPPANGPEILIKAASWHEEACSKPVPPVPFSRAWDEEPESPHHPRLSDVMHARLLAGDFAGALQMTRRKRETSDDRSSRHLSWLAAFLLVAATEKGLAGVSRTTSTLWEDALCDSIGYFSIDHLSSKDKATWDRITAAYSATLVTSETSREFKVLLPESLDWVMNRVRDRVVEIVSEGHRRAYHDAAKWLLACEECCSKAGREKQARRLTEEMRSRFPRHRAFLDELEKARAKNGR